MEKHTLYDALRFLIHLISFYGFNETKPILKGLNVVIKVLGLLPLSITLFVYFLCYLSKVPIFNVRASEDNMKFFPYLKLYFGANVSCFFLCHFRKNNFNALLKILNGFDVSETFLRKIRKLKILFGGFYLCFLAIVWRELNDDEGPFLVLCLRVALFSFTYLYFLCLPLCSLPLCAIAYYIKHALSERIEKINKCKSTLRKTKLTTRLMSLSTRLDRLTERTNDYGAPLMFVLKTSAITASATSIYSACVNFELDWGFVMEALVYHVPCVTFPFVYACYQRVAPSANRTPCMMARVMTENVLSDDQEMSREPISRLQLLRERLVHLAYLTHSNFNQNKFTVLGDPVDETDIFMVFVEIVDKLNSFKSLF